MKSKLACANASRDCMGIGIAGGRVVVVVVRVGCCRWRLFNLRGGFVFFFSVSAVGDTLAWSAVVVMAVSICGS